MRLSSLFEALAIVGFFLLRLGVPVAITILVTWWLRRLDAKWQAEAGSTTAARPVAAAPQPPSRPCWQVINCPEERRSKCPAFLAPELACWLARLRSDGRMPTGCANCAVYSAARGAAAAAD